MDEEYVPHLTSILPPADRFWDIPLSPNARLFQVFNEFDRRILDAQRMPMEFESMQIINTQLMREASINTILNLGDKISADSSDHRLYQIPEMGLNLQ